MKRRYFGTDGVRGPYGGPVINEGFAARLGEAAGRFVGGAGKVLIGRDTRASGATLASAVAAGLARAGLEPVMLGVLPTPAVARAVRTEGAWLGVVVTASHNPAGDNGIKFFAANGTKLSDEDEATIEALLSECNGGAAGAGKFDSVDGTKAYVDAVARMLPGGALEGWTIVVDAANGATAETTPAVLRRLGARVELIGGAPDGTNINAGVGSEHPQGMAAAVRAVGARLGVAHDGDGDRCILCDETGAVLDGDEILTLLATEALARGRLAADTLVVTVQSNLGVDAAVRAAGGRVERSAVGDRYVVERMRAVGATLGGESSGHIVFSEVSPTGDGLVAALLVIAAMRETGRPLSELRGRLRKFPQVTRNLRVVEKRPLETLPPLTEAMRAVENELGAGGRILVRYSGTEAKLRLLVEAETAQAAANGLARLEAAARDALEVLD